MLSDWYYNSPSGEYSGPDFDRLIALVSHPQFMGSDVTGFSASKRNQLLDWFDAPIDANHPAVGSWRLNVPVSFQIPEGKMHWTNASGCTFVVPGLHHHSITEIMHQAFETQTNLHFTPFEQWWKPSPGSPLQ